MKTVPQDGWLETGQDCLSVIIPTYQREQVLIDTIESMRSLEPKPFEILVVDQSPSHEPTVAAALADLHATGVIRHIRQAEPNIPKAMNLGLLTARSRIVLFVDDDILPEPELVEVHIAAHRAGKRALIAGRVIQPWQESQYSTGVRLDGFASSEQRLVKNFMGGNFSVDRKNAIALGGFDENFVSVAFNFEAEFAYRLRKSGQQIYYEPRACIHHLKAGSGGTRSFGEHLTTARGDHAVGAYYHLLRTRDGWRDLRELTFRPLGSIMTRHHVRRPWWIPVSLLAELRGFLWAVHLARKGPKFIRPPESGGEAR